jgi:hypothetical protein
MIVSDKNRILNRRTVRPRSKIMFRPPKTLSKVPPITMSTIKTAIIIKQKEACEAISILNVLLIIRLVEKIIPIKTINRNISISAIKINCYNV